MNAPLTQLRFRSPARRVPRVRAGVQAAYFVVTLLVGAQFLRFFSQASAGGPITAAKPGGIEAFLPIAALVGTRRLLLTHRWDDVHPAGLAFFLGAIASAVVARRAFCSWLCPIGTLSSALEWLRAKVGLPARWETPWWLRKLAIAPKYFLLAAFVLGIFVLMPPIALNAFLHSPYNLVADAKLLELWRRPTQTVIAVTLGLAALSFVVRNGWCRSLCPYGALLGMAGKASPFRVVRNVDKCIPCGACTRACPSGIRVDEGATVRSWECTSCVSCIAACNVEGALEMRGARKHPWLVPALGVGVLAAAWLWAHAAGYWQTRVTPAQFIEAYQTELHAE